MSTLLLFNRRSTCKTCRLRRGLISHLKTQFANRNHGLQIQEFDSNAVAELYANRGCASFVKHGAVYPVDYDFNTRSDAACKTGKRSTLAFSLNLSK
jgi:hypothetical protein